MENKIIWDIEKIMGWLIISLAFLLPIFFLPITIDFYEFNKQTLLIVFTSLLLILWLIKMVLNQKLVFRRSPLDLPLLLLMIAFIIASLMTKTHKTIPFLASTGTGTIISLTLIYFIITNNLKSKFLPYLFSSLIISAVFLSLATLYQSSGLTSSFTNLPWLEDKWFTPLGSILILISFLFLGLILTLYLFVKQLNKKEYLITFLTGGACFIITLSLILSIHNLTPELGKDFAFLSYRDSWIISIESLKTNPLFGVGPGNYISAFSRFKPLSFNQNDFWNFRFDRAIIYPLDLLTTGGLLVFFAYLFLIIKIGLLFFKSYQQRKENQRLLLIILAITLIIPWLIGINLVILSLTYILLAFFNLKPEETKQLSFSSKKIPPIILTVGLAIILFFVYLWGRIYVAEIVFTQSLDSLAKNQGIPTYNQQIRAIKLNPYSPLYRRVYSQTNLILAFALVNQPDQASRDWDKITSLFQQTVREAKIATVLNPTDAVNWENLAQTYRSLLRFADKSDQWAITSYQQAIINDPFNPQIRIELGGLHYSLEDFEQATRQFEIAVSLKSDYANAYYNLSATYREREMYQEAYNAMQNVVNLVDPNSTDYQKAKNELEALAKELPQQQEKAVSPETEESSLTEPSPLPSPITQPLINLSEESSP